MRTPSAAKIRQGDYRNDAGNHNAAMPATSERERSVTILWFCVSLLSIGRRR
jgi:hypothetical protein